MREHQREEPQAFLADRIDAHVAHEFVQQLDQRLQTARHQRALLQAEREQSDDDHGGAPASPRSNW